MTDVAKMIAEIEEAERAATPPLLSRRPLMSDIEANRVNELAEILPVHVMRLGNLSTGLSLTAWNKISNDILEAATLLRALDEALERQRETFSGPAAWLDSWAQHVGNCKGGYVCTCGLTLARTEAAAALQETTHD